MDKNEIYKKLCDILVSEFEFKPEKLTPEARLYEDLDFDSIDAIDLVVRLQQDTSLRVSAEDFKSIQTLDDVAGVIARLMAEQSPKP